MEGGSPDPRGSPGPVRSEPTNTNAIAIIGISGRYAQAPDLRAFWQNLIQGKDCITEIPADRWPRPASSSRIPKRPWPTARATASGGSFIDGFADFDPLFLYISPSEAMKMDPQERAIPAGRVGGAGRRGPHTRHARAAV